MECLTTQLLWIIAFFGLITMGGALWKMKEGFGYFNLRVIGIILVSVIASLIAVVNKDALNATMGILGAIVGYLFGLHDSSKGSKSKSSVDLKNSSIGDNSNVIGRDLIQKIETLNSQLTKVADSIIPKLIHETSKLEIEELIQKDYLLKRILNIQYESHDHKTQQIHDVVSTQVSNGWFFIGIFEDTNLIGGIILVFSRIMKGDKPNVILDQ